MISEYVRLSLLQSHADRWKSSTAVLVNSLQNLAAMDLFRATSNQIFNTYHLHTLVFIYASV